jgi:hypothetical protein
MLTPICKVLVLSFCLMECVAFNIKMKEVTSLSKDQLSVIKIKNALAPAVATFTACVLFPFSALAINQQYRLPPIDYADKNRCVLTSSAVSFREFHATHSSSFEIYIRWAKQTLLVINYMMSESVI